MRGRVSAMRKRVSVSVCGCVTPSASICFVHTPFFQFLGISKPYTAPLPFFCEGYEGYEGHEGGDESGDDRDLVGGCKQILLAIPVQIRPLDVEKGCLGYVYVCVCVFVCMCVRVCIKLF